VKIAVWLAAAALPLAAQPKLLVNAKIDTRSASAGLERVFQELVQAQPQPAWIGYSVPTVRGSGFLGCDYVRDGFNSPGVIHLEPPDTAVILFRVDGSAVNRIRTLSPDCEIDAGGVPFHWLADVPPAQSITVLASFVSQRDRLGDSVVSAIAAHADPSADQVLGRLLAPEQPISLRQRAVSALGTYRGRYGFEVLKKLVASDPDDRIRERAVSAMGNSRDPEAQDTLIAIAKSNPEPKLRSQAVSALNRRPSGRTAETLAAIVENDPDLSVKRRAISTLRGLPDDQGIPVLIQLARTSHNPEVKKQAISSLSQSRDPRAAALFEEILKK
jgi:hypothetical protein